MSFVRLTRTRRSEAWRFAIENKGTPIALVLTRQNLPILEGTKEKAKEGLRRGAYVLADAEGGKPRAQIIASGSEVAAWRLKRSKLWLRKAFRCA